jgi:hypothetical protein
MGVNNLHESVKISPRVDDWLAARMLLGGIHTLWIYLCNLVLDNGNIPDKDPRAGYPRFTDNTRLNYCKAQRLSRNVDHWSHVTVRLRYNIVNFCNPCVGPTGISVETPLSTSPRGQ